MKNYKRYVLSHVRGQFIGREEARERLTKKIESQRRLIADPNGFSTYDPNYIIADAERRLRWIDCAPEGANHQVAPLQGDYGIPCGGFGSTAVGPSRGVREEYERRHGCSWIEGKLEQRRLLQEGRVS